MTDSPYRQLLIAIELHRVEGIREAVHAGADPNAVFQGCTALEHMTFMYTRSPAFSHCVRTLLDLGARAEDPVLAAVLLDDGDALRSALRAHPDRLGSPVSLKCAFTPLVNASLLHVAAEFGCLDAAGSLIELGADVEARSIDPASGGPGHTPIFHCVNANRNHGQPILRLLLDAGAETDVLVPRLTWGKDCEWETEIFDVTPISYALMGLLPQFHRKEQDIAENVALMLRAAGRTVPEFRNVPNQYLKQT